ncbi:MAG: hypothetical protein ACE366_20610 [Bradymonadia bacterium]
MRHTPDLLLPCPHCGALARQPGPFRGGFAGARFWTDGRVYAPMVPEIPAATQCGACGGFYWCADISPAGQVSFGDPKAPDAWLEAPPTRQLDAAGVLQALQAGLGDTTAREKRLRIMAWHRANDAVRPEHPGQRPAELPTADYAENGARLLVLLDAGAEGEALIRIELLRNLGHLDQALEAIDRLWSPGATPIAQQITQALEAGRTAVERIWR